MIFQNSNSSPKKDNTDTLSTINSSIRNTFLPEKKKK